MITCYCDKDLGLHYSGLGSLTSSELCLHSNTVTMQYSLGENKEFGHMQKTGYVQKRYRHSKRTIILASLKN